MLLCRDKGEGRLKVSVMNVFEVNPVVFLLLGRPSPEAPN